MLICDSWISVPARYLFDEINERGFDLPLASVTRDGGVEYRTDLSISVWNPGEDTSGYKRVLPGDFVIGLRSFQSGIGASAIEGLVSPAYTVLRPTSQRVDLNFIRHLFKSAQFISRLENVAQGIRQGRTISTDDFFNIPLPVPPLSVQRAIASHLDRETARIDALIEKKQRLIVAARERFMGSVDEVMSLSSQEVPTPPLSTVVQIAEGQVDPRESPFSDLPLIAPNHVESGNGKILDVQTASQQGAISGKYLCEAGDVIYSKIRPALRKACLAPSRCLTSADMYPMRPRAEIIPNYLLYFLLSNRFTDFAVSESERVAMPKINRDAFGRIRIPLPSLKEQEQAVLSLRISQRWADRIVSKLSQQLLILQERRQALISAAVTGHIKIPGEAQ